MVIACIDLFEPPSSSANIVNFSRQDGRRRSRELRQLPYRLAAATAARGDPKTVSVKARKNSQGGNTGMRRAVIASVVVLGFAVPASAETKFFVVSDTVGNCSVVEGGYSAGLSPIGNKDGYASAEDADKGLAEVRENAEMCKGVVE